MKSTILCTAVPSGSDEMKSGGEAEARVVSTKKCLMVSRPIPVSASGDLLHLWRQIADQK